MAKLSRREALQRMAALGALGFVSPASLLSSCSRIQTNSSRPLNGAPPSFFDKISPVDRFKDKAVGFSGDNPDRFHEILWNKQAVMKERKPVSTERHPVVIVGGGMSGIFTAYLLRDLNPVLLDRSDRFGGNSRGEAWEGVEYSIGAAYLMGVDKDSPLNPLYREGDVFNLCRHRKDADPVLLKNKLYTEFWKGQTDPAAIKQFQRVSDFFQQRLDGKVKIPSVPAESPEDIPLLAELDRYDYLSYLTRAIGEPLHPHVHTLLELYSWSTLGASMQEVSAASAIPTYAAEFGEVMVAPAGNSSIAERYLKLFLKDRPETLVRPSCVVVDVSPRGETVHVTYLDQHGVMRKIEASAVVMACPKFIAKKLIDGFEKDRGDAMKFLEYRAYAVGNACLDRPVTRDLHDVYLLNEGEIPFGDTQRNQHNHGSTDVTFANFAQTKRDKSVLTVYHPLPFTGGRPELLMPDSYERISREIGTELREKILPCFGYRSEDLRELRLTRWGHPIPVAKPGFYFTNSPEKLAKPIKDRIFFVNQDTWAAPAIETCALEALKWAPKVKEVV